MKRQSFVIWFKKLSIADVPLVGGKNAALGEMISRLSKAGIPVPDGFAITANGYRFFLATAGLDKKIESVLAKLNTRDIKNLRRYGRMVRRLILNAEIPPDLRRQIERAYRKLERKYGGQAAVAVRSSATAEDLPGASFAGQQETYLNVRGISAVLEAVKKSIASLFTDRAISYRHDKGFGQLAVAMSVGVQKMVRSDLAVSGVMFTLDTESGFDKVVVINSAYGLGPALVGGEIIPDEFVVFKPALLKGYSGIIARDLGEKDRRVVYGKKGIKWAPVSAAKRRRFSLTDGEIRQLARWAIVIEKHFDKPMDIEWAKDGRTGELFIVQARPETVHIRQAKNVYYEYHLQKKGKILAEGVAVGMGIAGGKAHVIKSAAAIESFKEGEVLVTEATDPDWEPIMKMARAIVTDKGGRTSHAAIVSRELGIPAVVGVGNATKKLQTGEAVTVDCSSGRRGVVYRGILPFKIIKHELSKLPKTKIKIMVNIGSPDEAFKNYYLPVKGVGLGRLEFIIGSHIGIHPNALIDFPKIKKQSDKASRRLAREIEKKTRGYRNKKQFYIDELAEGIAKIAAAFWPQRVIIRFSDFKTNEYRTLLGGDLYEPEEANPMIGWRGASRYYDKRFEQAFGLECAAVKKTRKEIGLDNVAVMVPFCRTVGEGEKVVEVMKKYGLDRGRDSGLKIYMMCEIPSNVVRAEEFLKTFDGLSIGSNDLTQLTLGLDRDAGALAHIGNENDPAVKKLISQAITAAEKRKKYVGICGQAPSDFPEFAVFLVKEGIGSISLNPTAVIKTLPLIAAAEKELLKGRKKSEQKNKK